MAYTDPPAHLSDRTTQLWRELVGSRAKSPERIALLQTALEALDRADEARDILDREGLIVGSTSGKMPHVHPASRIEKDALAQFHWIWARLHLDWNRRDGS